MWGAIIVGVAYALVLLRFGRHAYNGGTVALAAIGMLVAAGTQQQFERMQAGETQTWFRGALVLYEYGKFATAGVLLIGFSLLIQAAWLWLAFKLAMDEEYKSKTPAGVQPGASSQTDEFGRSVYVLTRKFLGEPEYQKMDAGIVNAFGGFSSKLAALRAQGHDAHTIAMVMAVEVWRRNLAALSERDRERMRAWMDAPEKYDLRELPLAAEQIAVALRASSQMASDGAMDATLPEMFLREITAYLRGGPELTTSFEERTARNARSFAKDALDSLMAAIQDFFDDIERELKALYIETLSKRLEMLPANRETLIKERNQFADEVRNLRTDTQPQFESRLGEWMRVSDEMGIREQVEQHVAQRYAEVGQRFIQSAAQVFAAFEASIH